MQAPPRQVTGPALRLLEEGGLSGEWLLDPRRSSIRLRTKVMGVVPVKGVFREISGAGTASPDGTVSGRLSVVAASIDTGITRRDTHLRSADILHCRQHPEISFTVDVIQPSGQGVTVTGALTVRGQTRPVSFEATATAKSEDEIWLDASTRINRADFGLIWKPDYRASMIITMLIHAVLARQ